MKRLHVCEIFHGDMAKGRGGILYFHLRLAKWLLDRDVRVTLVYRKSLRPVVQDFSYFLRRINYDKYLKTPARVFHLPYLISQVGLLLFSLLSIRHLISINKKHRISLIHSQDIGLGGVTAVLASALLHVPVIVHSHEDTVECVEARYEHKIGVGIPYLVLCKGLTTLINRFVMKKSNIIVATTEARARTHRRCLISLGANPSKVVTVPDGIDVREIKSSNRDKKKACNSLNIREKSFVVGYVGRLSPEKNVGALIKAVAEIINLRIITNLLLLIVGDGPEKAKLSRLAEEAGIKERVIFTGFRKDVPEILPAIDVWALLSFTEGCSSALLEAMAAGKAIIASSIPSIREFIDNGDTGLLVDPTDIAEIRKTILKLYEDAELRTNLGCNALVKADLYDQEKTNPPVLTLYKKLAYESK